MQNKKRTRAGSEVQYGPRRVGEILRNYLENSNEPWAEAYRKRHAKERSEEERNFWKVHPHTEPCIDLKLLTRRAGPMNVGDFLPGVITRDDEYHYSFVQNAGKERPVSRRTPCIFRGMYVNVHRADDGTTFVTFRRPRITENLGFADFCCAAAEELIIVAGLIKK